MNIKFLLHILFTLACQEIFSSVVSKNRLEIPTTSKIFGDQFVEAYFKATEGSSARSITYGNLVNMWEDISKLQVSEKTNTDPDLKTLIFAFNAVKVASSSLIDS